MHHYPFNVGDYLRKTAHLSIEEDCAYRRLLDLYYETEKPIPNETQTVSRRLRMGSQTVIVESVLREFFILHDDNCWHQTHCDEVILAYQSKCEHNKAAGLKGGRPKKNPNGFQTVPENNPNQNHKPEPEPILKANVASDAGQPPCPHEKIIELYHTILPTLPTVRVWTEARKKNLAARWREDVSRQNLVFWENLFGYIGKSDFLCGRTKTPFTCNLEWIVNLSNFVKIIEGKYENVR